MNAPFLCLGLAALAWLGARPMVRGNALVDHVVERHFASELELRTESFELAGSEEERSVEQEGPRYVREQADEVEIEDTLQDDEDPPASFSRLYRTVTSSFRMGTEDSIKERTASAGLEGKTVLFERQEDGSYARSSEDADARPGQLKRLRAELSLRCFLPEGELEPGSSWELAPTDLLRLVAPVEEGARRGPNAKAPAKKGGLDLAPVALTEPLGALMSALEGSFEATRLAVSDEDEWPCQAELRFRLESSFDGSASLLQNREAEVEDELELTYEGTGTLAWDPSTGRVELTCQGDLRMRESFRMEIEGNGKTGEVHGRLEVAGSLELEGSEGPR